jgi:hypothetical protein
MELQKRKPTRLKNFDYSSQGAYFITKCTHNRKNLFSNIVGSIISNAIGYLKMNISRDIHNNGYSGNIFQRSFHDHIIHGEDDYLKIWNTSTQTLKNGKRIVFIQNKKELVN